MIATNIYTTIAYFFVSLTFSFHSCVVENLFKTFSEGKTVKTRVDVIDDIFFCFIFCKYFDTHRCENNKKLSSLLCIKIAADECQPASHVTGGEKALNLFFV
jgi:hypothetical protein